MTLPVGGIDPYAIREIMFILRHDTDLVGICLGTFNLLQICSDLVTNQMCALFDEIEYWRTVLESSPTKYFIRNLFFTGPSQFLVQSRRFIFDSSITEESHTVDLRLSILKEMFSNLAVLLGSIHRCASELRLIYSEFDNIAHKNLHSSIIFDISHMNYEILSHTERDIFYRSCENRLVKCLQFIQSVFGDVVESQNPAHNSSSTPRFSNRDIDALDFRPADTVKSLNASGNSVCSSLELYQRVKHIIDEVQVEWPAAIFTNFIRRPSHFQQNWIKYYLLAGGAALATAWVVKSLQSGYIQQMYQYTSLLLQTKLNEHVVSPVNDLVAELFDTLRRREVSVTDEDHLKSKEALARMLIKYSNKQSSSQSSSKSPAAIVDYVVGKTKPLLGDTSPPPAPSSSDASVTIALASSEEFDRDVDKIMDGLMKSYESELMTPINGMLFGDLPTILLIQMQKLKIDTESVILSMYQVLASNELTMAVTAAIPGLAILGGMCYSVYRLFQPRTVQVNRLKDSMRLTFAELERSLLDCAYCSEKKELQYQQYQDWTKSLHPPPSPVLASPSVSSSSSVPVTSQSSQRQRRRSESSSSDNGNSLLLPRDTSDRKDAHLDGNGAKDMDGVHDGKAQLSRPVEYRQSGISSRSTSLGSSPDLSASMTKTGIAFPIATDKSTKERGRYMDTDRLVPPSAERPKKSDEVAPKSLKNLLPVASTLPALAPKHSYQYSKCAGLFYFQLFRFYTQLHRARILSPLPPTGDDTSSLLAIASCLYSWSKNGISRLWRYFAQGAYGGTIAGNSRAASSHPNANSASSASPLQSHFGSIKHFDALGNRVFHSPASLGIPMLGSHRMSESDGMLRDLLDLCNPNYDDRRKLELTSRMRHTYSAWLVR